MVSLVYRVAPERRAELLAFFRGAFPYYERPGGIRMGLYESVDEPGLIFELVSYATEAEYTKDQERVEKDPECREVLAEWRKLLAGPVEVRRMRPLSLTSS
ncbi:NIPSNAP family protein [bacterium]|nr:NIPSNAP family protein [bacterium]